VQAATTARKRVAFPIGVRRRPIHAHYTKQNPVYTTQLPLPMFVPYEISHCVDQSGSVSRSIPIEPHENVTLTIMFQPRRVLPLQTLHELCDELEMAEIAIGPERRLHVETVEELGEPVRGIKRDEAVLRATRGVSGRLESTEQNMRCRGGIQVVSRDAGSGHSQWACRAPPRLTRESPAPSSGACPAGAHSSPRRAGGPTSYACTSSGLGPGRDGQGRDVRARARIRVGSA
jgi:hypothetical protein